ncbi:hypothetical protein [Mycobacterium avium]
MPSGLGPPTIRLSEHISKNDGRSGSASTVICAHSDDTRATTRSPSASSRSVSASSVTIAVTSASMRWKNCHASRALGAA